MKDRYVEASIPGIQLSRCVEVYGHLYDTPSVIVIDLSDFDTVFLLFVKIEAVKDSRLRVVCDTRQSLDGEFKDFISKVEATLCNKSDCVDRLYLRVEMIRAVKNERTLIINGEEVEPSDKN